MDTHKIVTKNAAYQQLEVLRTNRNKRHKQRVFMVEGVRNINEAVKNEWVIHSFIYSYEKELSRWASGLLSHVKTAVNYEMSRALMESLSGKEDTSELLAIVEMKKEGPPGKALSPNPVLALFDRPSNKGNLGTLLRSCDAFGVEQLIITGHAVDIYDPEVVTSSMGSFFSVPFVRLPAHDEVEKTILNLKQAYPALQLIGTTAHRATTIYEIDLKIPVLFLIGNESDGLSWRLKALSDKLATIPMSQTSAASSFNVSCAATVMFYEARRQRGV